MSVIRKGSRPKTCVPAPSAPSAEPSAEPMVEVASVVASVVAPVVAPVAAPVRKKRPTKVVLKEPMEASTEPEVPKANTKATKTTRAKATKEPKVSKKATEHEIPLLHKEVTLPTHQEMDMEEYSAEGFHIEYVPLSVFTHDGTTYFRDKRKNKLYQYSGPRRVGPYLGRYHPGREEIFTDLPDSDAEEP